MLHFIKYEKRVAALTGAAFLFSLIYLITSRMPESFSYGKEIMDLLLNVSLSILAATIFYIIQIYLPRRRVQIVVRKEVARMHGRVVSAFSDILSGCSTEDEIKGFSIHTVDDLFSSKVAMHISIYFNPETLAPIIPETSWLNRLSQIANEDIKGGVNSILTRYAVFLDEDSIDALHAIEWQGMVVYMQTLTNPGFLKIKHDTGKRIALPVNFLDEMFGTFNHCREIFRLDNATVSLQPGLR